MALITRVSRLFQADLHAVLDRIEEPDVLLRQAVREMEDELAKDEQCMKLLRHEQQQLITRQADIERTLQEVDEELDLCFESAKEDLARPLVKRKLETLQFKKSLERKQQAADQALTTLQARLEENRGQLESMRQKMELLVDENRPEQVADSWVDPQVCIRDEDVEVAFLREKQQRSKS
jgi:phage shock protein A